MEKLGFKTLINKEDTLKEFKNRKRRSNLQFITTIAILIMIMLSSSISFAIGSIQENPPTEEVPVDEQTIVAIVNGDIITVNDFKTLARIYSADLSDKSQREEILENLINDKVAVQMAKNKGIVITDADVEKDIDLCTSLNRGSSINRKYELM